MFFANRSFANQLNSYIWARDQFGCCQRCTINSDTESVELAGINNLRCGRRRAETAQFRQAHVQRVLAAFKTGPLAFSSSSFLTFGTASGRFTLARRYASSNPVLFSGRRGN